MCVYGIAMLNLFRDILSYARRKKTESYLNNLIRQGLRIGKNTEILEPFFFDPDHCFLITVGENCTLAPNVRLIAHDASTKQYLGFTRIGKITIGDNCFIGDSTIILPNVSIGPNTIIGAGTIINKDVPGGVVAAGNPVKVICSLDEYIKKVEARAKEKGVFGKEYLIENISTSDMNKLLEGLNDQEGYIV